MQNTVYLEPENLSTIPSIFFESDIYKCSASLKDKEELANFRAIIACFLNYKNDSYIEFNKRKWDLSQIKEEQLKLLQINPIKRSDELVELLKYNQGFFNCVVDQYFSLFDFNTNPNIHFKITQSNRKKIITLLRQFNREWGSLGIEERDQSFLPILEELETAYKNTKGVKVLVPGCGLGRLPFEIAQLGFDCQGNEFSYFMLLGSALVLNRLSEPLIIYPFIHKFSNNKTEKKNFTMVQIPDQPLETLPDGVDFSMTAGEFVEVYRDQKEQWDCVVTCFFIDTAKNVLDYIDVIYDILKPGGRWINLGPLLYHYSDTLTEISVELSAEELRQYISAKGFEFSTEQWVKSKYCAEPDNMLESIYNCWFFSCVKKLK